MKIYQRVQWLKFKISNFWDTTVSVFSISIVIFALSLCNGSIAYLMPFAICTDILILSYSAFIRYKRTFTKMRHGFLNFTVLENVDENLKQLYLSEARKFRIFEEGNIFGTKSISVYISKKITGAPTSYSFFNDESIILLHKDFDKEEPIDRFVLLHEMGHCIFHSLIEQKQAITFIQSTLLALIVVFSSVILCSWRTLSLGLFLFVILLFCGNNLSVKSRIEMGADAVAVIIFEHLYGRDKMKEVVDISTQRYYSEIEACSLKDFGYLLNSIYSISRFLSDSDREHYISKIDVRISEEVNATSGNKALVNRLKAFKKKLTKAPKLETFTDGILTWNPAIYYVVYPLLMLFAWESVSHVMHTITIPWWFVFICIVPIAFIIIIRKQIVKTVTEKSDFIQNILNNQNL